MKEIKKVFARVVVLMVLVNSAAYANLVINGGFETTGSYIQKCTNVTADPDTISLWKFNEGVGGSTLTDDGTGGNHGTLDLGSSGNVTTSDAWVTGISGHAITFDGVDDYVNCGNDPSLDIPNAITVEAWVKASGAGSDVGPGIITKRTGGFGIIYMDLAETSVHSRIYEGDSTTIDLATFSMSQNVWHHIVLLADSGSNKLRIYLDSVEKATKTYDGTIKTGSSNLLIGQQLETYFHGTIDEVRISNVARICPYAWDVTADLTGNLCHGCLYQVTDNPTYVHSGLCSLKMSPTTGATVEFSTQVTSNITVQSKGKYKISGWIRTDTNYTSSADYQPKIVVKSGGNETILVSKRSETLDTWQRYYGYITAGNTELTVTLKCYGTTGSCWFDDIELDIARPGTMIMIGQAR